MKATIAVGNDWSAVYIDGRKITEGHSINPRDLLNALGYSVESVEPERDPYGESDFPELLINLKEAPTA